MIELTNDRRKHQVVTEDSRENKTYDVERAIKTTKSREHIKNIVNCPLILLVDRCLTKGVFSEYTGGAYIFLISLNALNLIELEPLVLWHSKAKVIIICDSNVLLDSDFSILRITAA